VGEVFNEAYGRQYSLMDIIQILGHELPDGTPPLRWHHAPARPGDVRHTRADLTKAARGLGYQPVVGFEAGLRDTLAAGCREAVRVGR